MYYLNDPITSIRVQIAYPDCTRATQRVKRARAARPEKQLENNNWKEEHALIVRLRFYIFTFSSVRNTCVALTEW